MLNIIKTIQNEDGLENLKSLSFVSVEDAIDFFRLRGIVTVKGANSLYIPHDPTHNLLNFSDPDAIRLTDFALSLIKNGNRTSTGLMIDINNISAMVNNSMQQLQEENETPLITYVGELVYNHDSLSLILRESNGSEHPIDVKSLAREVHPYNWEGCIVQVELRGRKVESFKCIRDTAIMKYIDPDKDKKTHILENILTHNNKRKARYRDIIERAESIDAPDSFASCVYSALEEDPEAIKLLKEKISGGMVVDLGGGRASMYQLAEQLGASVYILVDIACIPGAPLNPTEPVYRILHKGKTMLIEVQADMLDFVSRLAPNSVHFCINGIDSFVIAGSNYHIALANEIDRSCAGIALGMESNVFAKLKQLQLTDLKCCQAYQQNNSRGVLIYERNT